MIIKHVSTWTLVIDFLKRLPELWRTTRASYIELTDTEKKIELNIVQACKGIPCVVPHGDVVKATQAMRIENDNTTYTTEEKRLSLAFTERIDATIANAVAWLRLTHVHLHWSTVPLVEEMLLTLREAKQRDTALLLNVCVTIEAILAGSDCIAEPINERLALAYRNVTKLYLENKSFWEDVSKEEQQCIRALASAPSYFRRIEEATPVEALIDVYKILLERDAEHANTIRELRAANRALRETNN